MTNFDCPKCKSDNTDELQTLTGQMEDFICHECKHVWWPYPGPWNDPFNKIQACPRCQKRPGTLFATSVGITLFYLCYECRSNKEILDSLDEKDGTPLQYTK